MSNSSTLFIHANYSLAALMHSIDSGSIGLPDIQRPFVWTATKVRDLFDSMYKGFPVGYLLFWANPEANDSKFIGLEKKAHKVASYLIIDGQQRLTSLYAVCRGKAVLNKNYQEARIEIAFRPQDGKFEVADAAIRKDPEFIPNISELWTSKKGAFFLINDFMKRLESKRPLSEEDRKIIAENITELFNLQNYPFTVLEIASNVDEEQVADIFVRINSKGVSLNQADFILTLMSVFWEEGRKEMEQFSRASRIPPKANSGPSPFNYFIQPDPDQLLRVAIALGFYRGRLRSVYQVLRGKDINSGLFMPALRDQQFDLLREAQAKVLNLTHWHQFLVGLVGAGFRGGELISSQNALLYAYAFYLIGKTRFSIPYDKLQKLIGRWFYASSLSGRYTSSPETTMESDLNLIKDLSSADAYIAALNKIISDTLTSDYWTITLPNDLVTSSSQSPGLFAFYAAQIKLDAPALFSKIKIDQLFDPMLKLKKKALDRHHLFPRAWLERQGITDLKLINQVANFSLVEWPDNIAISDAPPYEYLPKIQDQKRFDANCWARMCGLHALPEGWEYLPYEEFLRQRRMLMAQIIRRGFEALG